MKIIIRCISLTGCNLRHYGLDCSKKCSENCIKEICNTTNGSCTFGCKGGFYGNLCNESCSISCPSGCNRYTGYCDGICPVTYFGHFCEKICNSNCLGGCNRETGLCDFGCIDGKFGELCNETCSIGCNSICEQENENCSCKADWKGDNCDEESRNRLNSHLETFVGVGLGVVSSILIVVGIVYCILRMITRKRRSSKQQRNHSNKDMVIYENINETTNFDKRDDIQECVYWNQFSPNKSARNNDEISISRDSNVVNHGIYVNDTNQNSESKISTRVCGEGINTNTLVVDEEDAYMAIRGFDQEENMYEELKIT
ncbi:multiple epidermal growth factor-like domains protein 10 [Saccostrea cucullata]|uniref:multiple epidermal growth factor-like domains protein 10 n=1 Tax=Saccostrea cuccullata TaxID=36930 RepID=UPI002ED34748